MPDTERGQTTVAGRWTVRPGTTSSIEPPFHPRGLPRPPVWRMRPILRLHVIWRNFPVVAKKKNRPYLPVVLQPRVTGVNSIQLNYLSCICYLGNPSEPFKSIA